MNFYSYLCNISSMSTPVAPLIDAGHVAFIQSGVSISIGGCDANHQPWVGKGLGCRVTADRRTITVFAAASHSPELMAALAQTGAIAVVFSQPSTHRTLQLKGKDARVIASEAADQIIVNSYRDDFITELLPLGFDERPIRAFLACEATDLVRISFSPCAAFTQTPGPHAGQPLQASD
jgi:hypothetical protein